MITKESHFQGKFSRWMEDMGKIDCVYELKVSHGNTVNFKCFQDQQLPSLWKAYTTGLNHKITDLSFGSKPFDGFFHLGDSYVGIMFNIPINQKEFYLIHIREVMKLYGKQKSITKKNCQEMGIRRSF